MEEILVLNTVVCEAKCKIAYKIKEIYQIVLSPFCTPQVYAS